jgi:heterodisulfide reductase subunit A
MTGKEEPRIGVFVCHCGSNIGGWLDVPSVAEYADTLPNVVYAGHNLYTCAEDGLAAIRAAIKEHDLNRVIVASCTPRTHEPLFQGTIEEAGLNRYLFEFVNIRDQCSWIHMKHWDDATEKAKDLVRMGVAKAALLQPLERTSADVEPVALVIGGGIAGMTAAKAISMSGFDVHIVERRSVLGGLLNRLHRIWPTQENPKGMVDDLRKDLEANPRVNVHLGMEVKDLKGFVGNFEVDVGPPDGEAEDHFLVGTIIVATGAEEMRPDGLYGYGEHPQVLTQLELEARLRDDKVGDLGSVVIIQCTGSRGQRVTYCSRVCCMTGIKNAMELKVAHPEADVTVLYRDVVAYGISYEDLYQKARERGVRFQRFPLEDLPVVEASDLEGKVQVRFRDVILGRDFSRDADLVVLSAPLVQHEDAPDLAKLLRVPLGQDKFFFEAHVKLRPIDFASDGIFLCGTAHGPKDIEESIVQAFGAAARSLTFLKAGQVLSEPIVTFVDEESCIGCGNCIEVCPYGAIELKDGGKRGQVAEVNPGLCKGCGTCPGACPSSSIQQLGFTDGQILAMIKALANGGD